MDIVESELKKHIKKGNKIPNGLLQLMVQSGHLSAEAMDNVLAELQDNEILNEKRNNVISFRITDDINNKLDDLVSLSIAQSRSEAAYMLILEGVKSHSELFNEIKKHKEELKNIKSKFDNILVDFGK